MGSVKRPDWVEVPEPPETEQVQYTDLLETQDAAIDPACYDSLILENDLLKERVSDLLDERDFLCGQVDDLLLQFWAYVVGSSSSSEAPKEPN
jgi:hypothetical protein